MDAFFKFVWWFIETSIGIIFYGGGFWIVLMGALWLLVYLYEKWKSPSKKEVERQEQVKKWNISDEQRLKLEESDFQKKEEIEKSKRESEKIAFELEKEKREMKISEYLVKLPKKIDKIQPLKGEFEDLENELGNNLELEFSLKQKYLETKFLRESFNERTWYRGTDGKVEAMIKFSRDHFGGRNQYDHMVPNPYTYEDSELREKVKLDIKEIREKIKKTENKIKVQIEKQKNQDKIKEKSIRIAGYEDGSREIARTIRISKTKHCPYCGNDLGDEPHKDHIFPIAKGGLSKKENLVYVCNECNLNKSDLTLNQFIKKYDMDRDSIESNLEKLNKDF
jgi:5-methylcytosine-specific restriction endonuclease McrA